MPLKLVTKLIREFAVVCPLSALYSLIDIWAVPFLPKTVSKSVNLVVGETFSVHIAKYVSPAAPKVNVEFVALATILFVAFCTLVAHPPKTYPTALSGGQVIVVL